jgi:hypothetical protein
MQAEAFALRDAESRTRAAAAAASEKSKSSSPTAWLSKVLVGENR